MTLPLIFSSQNYFRWNYLDVFSSAVSLSIQIENSLKIGLRSKWCAAYYGLGESETNFGFRRSPPSVRSAMMATNRMVGTSTFTYIELGPPLIRKHESDWKKVQFVVSQMTRKVKGINSKSPPVLTSASAASGEEKKWRSVSENAVFVSPPWWSGFSTGEWKTLCQYLDPSSNLSESTNLSLNSALNVLVHLS